MLITKQLPVGMSDHEQQLAGKRLATLMHEITLVEDDARLASASYKTKLKPLRKDRDKLAEEVRNGQLMREVECEELRDAVTREIITRRLDTGEETRMPEEDHDGPLMPALRKRKLREAADDAGATLANAKGAEHLQAAQAAGVKLEDDPKRVRRGRRK